MSFFSGARGESPVQLLIRTHNETLSVVVRVSDPDRSPFAIQRLRPSPNSTAAGMGLAIEMRAS